MLHRDRDIPALSGRVENWLPSIGIEDTNPSSQPLSDSDTVFRNHGGLHEDSMRTTGGLPEDYRTHPTTRTPTHTDTRTDTRTVLNDPLREESEKEESVWVGSSR